MRAFRSHGNGRFAPEELGSRGEAGVIEDGVLIFRPDLVHLGDNVYIGHRATLKAYPGGGIRIAQDCWIGPSCFLSGKAELVIETGVGIGPRVQILTSTHRDPGRDRPIMDGELELGPVRIGEGSDLGAGCIVLPGVTVGRGVQVGAGAVVNADLPDYAVAAGVPASVLRFRDG